MAKTIVSKKRNEAGKSRTRRTSGVQKTTAKAAQGRMNKKMRKEMAWEIGSAAWRLVNSLTKKHRLADASPVISLILESLGSISLPDDAAEQIYYFGQEEGKTKKEKLRQYIIDGMAHDDLNIDSLIGTRIHRAEDELALA
jgi:hypothetical protein